MNAAAKKTLPALVAMGLLAGCAVTGPALPPPASVEGTWINPKGVALSRLHEGKLVTVATDTGKTLSTGTYRQVGEAVSIDFKSKIRRKSIHVDCRLDGADTLRCAAPGGKEFSLARKS